MKSLQFKSRKKSSLRLRARGKVVYNALSHKPAGVWMPKQIVLALLIALTTFSMNVFASQQIDVVETCSITDSKSFSNSTQIICDADLQIAPGVVLDAGANTLEIYSTGNIAFGEGSKLVSTARETNLISVFARTALGQLAVSTAADIEMEFASLAPEFQQSIATQYGAEVRMLVSGQSLLLEGPEHKITR